MKKHINKHIKKVFTILLLVGVLFAATPTSALAYTSSSQWQLQSGGADATFTEEGVSLECTSGLNVWEYAENTVDITDFSVTFTVGQEAWYGGAQNGMYQTIILKNKKEWSGSYGLFLLLMPSESGSLRVEGQILNRGFLLSPTYTTFDVDVTQPITLRGKLVDSSHYRLTVDGDEANAYVFEIPANYPFHTELDGQGYFCFGVCSSKEQKVEMKVTAVNDLDFTGTDPNAGVENTEESDDSSVLSPEESEGDVLKPDGTEGSESELTTNSEDDQNASAIGSVDMPVYVTLLICLCVLELVIIGGILFFFLYVNKKLKKQEKTVVADNDK